MGIIKYERSWEGEFVGEYWLQRYVKENPEKFKLSNIKWHPRSASYDLLATFDGHPVKIEVEWCCYDYIIHGHYKDVKFKDVAILICQDDIHPFSEDLQYLPKLIIYVDPDDFSRWYFRKTGKRSKVISNLLKT